MSDSGSPAPPDVSVVVVSWCTRDLTLRCIASVTGAAAADGVGVDVTVVDNASDDGSVDAIRGAFPGARVVALERNAGFGAACNAGAAYASGRYLLLLNSDAELPSGALAALAGFLDATPNAAAAGVTLVSEDGSPQFSCGRFLTPLNQFAEIAGLTRVSSAAAFRRSYRDGELLGPNPEVDWAVGACLLVRRDVFAAVGGFDEQFFMYCEDEDLGHRFRAAGRSVHCLTGVRVSHVGGASASRARDRMRREHRQSQILLLRKHSGPVSAFVFRALMRVADLKPGGRGPRP